ncbi:hypothetical protein E2562_021911 [Oryza meyeriana var. granulata]|uniref:Uncharacterized protein n=1 Tax=Oryza meyeriana var. granulata TaxID=110450 RepID=A0A6G1C8A4_9ORYZ|nr:hypothetical protein E2562_021911 [Oryza meyeriana var. granulata]
MVNGLFWAHYYAASAKHPRVDGLARACCHMAGNGHLAVDGLDSSALLRGSWECGDLGVALPSVWLARGRKMRGGWE